MARKRITSNLVYTTCDSPTKHSFAKKNAQQTKREFIITILGEKKKVSKEDYYRLVKAGYNVDTNILNQE